MLLMLTRQLKGFLNHLTTQDDAVKSGAKTDDTDSRDDSKPRSTPQIAKKKKGLEFRISIVVDAARARALIPAYTLASS
jgi:hypothetical protein